MAITLTTVSSGYNLQAINDNFQSLQTALNNSVLWKTGSVAGEAKMSRDLDMDGNAILNIGVDTSNPGSLLTVQAADLRYYNIKGDVLQGDMDGGQFQIKNLAAPSGQYDAVRKTELDVETSARQSADSNIQEQLTGNVPLEASAFSQISWHTQNIPNSVNIPDNRNAWSFGPQMEIPPGQAVTIGSGAFWTIANGRLVEAEDLHQLIADTITTTDASTTVQVDNIASQTSVDAVQAQANTSTSNINSLTTRMTAEENKTQPVTQGGTGAITATAARSNLGAAASGANTDITSITGSAATLTTARTIRTNLASTATASFDGSANITPGVTGTLAIANGGTGATTAPAARTSLGAAASAGVVDASNADTGVVGELLTATGSAVSLTTAVNANAVSLALTAGDWDISGAVLYTSASATPVNLMLSLSTSSATMAAFPNQWNIRPGAYAFNNTLPTGITRINVAASTTVYLVVLAEFSGGTMTATGHVRARRVR